MIDLTDYKTASRLSTQINRGFSDRLAGKQMFSPYTQTDHDLAYVHGWETADASERKAGRRMPRPMSEYERQQAIGAMLCEARISALDLEVARLQHTGHGHVVPRLDGVRTRCGGPAMCRVCQGEQAATSMVGG